MLIVNRTSIAVLLLVVMLSCKENSSADRQEGSDPTIHKLDSIGNSFVNSGQVLGLSVAIMKGSDTLYNQGFGYTDAGKNLPVTNETRFLMASVSKLIGSTMVMKLVDEGKLQLDQTLYELLPDYPNSEQGQKITLKHMLSHTSGLQDYAVEIIQFL